MVCHDCGAVEGEFHKEGCDMEICTNCRGQKIICGCNVKKREPYFESVYNCKRCGKTMPLMYSVDDEKWEFICGSTYPLDSILCRDCMLFISQKRIENMYNEAPKNKKLAKTLDKISYIIKTLDEVDKITERIKENLGREEKKPGVYRKYGITYYTNKQDAIERMRYNEKIYYDKNEGAYYIKRKPK